MDRLDQLAAYLATLHPAWRDRHWEDLHEDTRDLFRDDARKAVATWEGKCSLTPER